MAQYAPPDGAEDLIPAELRSQLAALSVSLAPLLSRLDTRTRAALSRYDRPARRALAAITLGAAARLSAAGKTPGDFLEQVAYNSRRLAKLNVSPGDAGRFLQTYDREAGRALGNSEKEHRVARARIQLVTQLVLERSYYEVREAETQVFYGLFRAEVEAASLDDLLGRSVEILTLGLRARSGRLLLTSPEGALSPALLRRLARPRYIERGSAEESLILDPAMRGRHDSYWSVPLRHEGRLGAVAQFGFAGSYRWLPRELVLLDAAGERCLAAAERTRLIRDLATRERQVRQLAAHLITAEEEERRRLSRELHDETGQSLLLLRLELELLQRSCPVEGEFRKRLSDAGRLAARSITEVRRAISALNPAVLERLGLEAAVRQFSARFEKHHPARIRLAIAPDLPKLSAGLQTVVYRLVQECYHNIAKHSEATRVKLSLVRSDKWLELRIADNGAGFEVDAALQKPDSFGLAGMRERVTALGGTLEISSRPGGGTLVVARLPRPQAELDDVENTSNADR